MTEYDLYFFYNMPTVLYDSISKQQSDFFVAKKYDIMH